LEDLAIDHVDGEDQNALTPGEVLDKNFCLG
jgi:hypothetical protein